MKSAENGRSVFLRALVTGCEPQSTQKAVCGLNEKKTGTEYLVVDQGPGQELAGYVGDEVEVRGTVRDEDGRSWISVSFFRPCGLHENDLEGESMSWDRSSHRREGFRDNDPDRSRMRSHTKDRQAARRAKNDRIFQDA